MSFLQPFLSSSPSLLSEREYEPSGLKPLPREPAAYATHAHAPRGVFAAARISLSSPVRDWTSAPATRASRPQSYATLSQQGLPRGVGRAHSVADDAWWPFER